MSLGALSAQAHLVGRPGATPAPLTALRLVESVALRGCPRNSRKCVCHSWLELEVRRVSQQWHAHPV